jgi:hypothetical protein
MMDSNPQYLYFLVGLLEILLSSLLFVETFYCDFLLRQLICASDHCAPIALAKDSRRQLVIIIDLVVTSCLQKSFTPSEHDLLIGVPQSDFLVSECACDF